MSVVWGGLTKTMCDGSSDVKIIIIKEELPYKTMKPNPPPRHQNENASRIKLLRLRYSSRISTRVEGVINSQLWSIIWLGGCLELSVVQVCLVGWVCGSLVV